MSYYGYDGHGSVRFLTDQTGAVTDSYTYDAFGTLIEQSGSTPNEYLYAGERFDAETGMYYLRARYMQPQTGRFWSMDSYGGNKFDPSSLHKYTFVSDNPTNLIDPSGREGIIEAVQSLAISTIVFAMTNVTFHTIVGGAAAALSLYAFTTDTEYRDFVLSTGGTGVVVADADFLIGATKKLYGTVFAVTLEAPTEDLLTLFRGERASNPPEKAFDSGFTPKGPNTNLLEHCSSNGACSNYIATTTDKSIAEGFAGKNGYVYEIRSSRGIDVNNALGDKSPFPEQLEVAIPGGIFPSEIMGVYPKRGGKLTGEFIPNPNAGGGH